MIFEWRVHARTFLFLSQGSLRSKVRAVTLFISLASASEADARFPSEIDLSKTSADVTLLGAAPYEKAGRQFSSGDYNGDGFPDILILSQGQVGASGFPFLRILWGGAARPAVIDFASYDGDVSTIRAMTGDDGFWANVESGDFNGDGFDDIAFGMPCTQFNCRGKVYLIFGAVSFPNNLDVTNPTIPVVTLLGMSGGPGFGGFFGWTSATGDINGDGFDDLAISAPELLPGGHVFVFLGREVMPPTIDLNDPATSVTHLIDPRPGMDSGTSLACGDVNADGFDDLLIGGGEVMIMLGSTGLSEAITLTTPPIKRYRNLPSFASQVDFADFNGDGYNDAVIAMPYSNPFGCEHCGEIAVAFGGQTVEDTLDVSSPNVTLSRLFGDGILQRYGWSLASGDVNADGYDDLLIGSRPDDYDQDEVGKVTIAYGGAVAVDSLFMATDATVSRIYAENRFDELGAGLYSFDLDFDGVQDLVLGGPWATAAGRSRAGQVYIQYGAPELTSIDPVASKRWFLGQNYPNPFNPSTQIPIVAYGRGFVGLHIYDVAGRLVKTLLNEELDAGLHHIPWDGTDASDRLVASGVYFYRLTGSSNLSRKMVLVR